MDRLNIITLGVRNLSLSKAFYMGLGFSTPNREENPGIVFFSNGGTRLALYSLEGLAEDIDKENPPERTGFPGFTLAYNAKTKEEVDDVFSKVESLGGRIVKHPQTVFWGGYSGYFQDPDGYYFEVAYADSWQFDENDMLVID